MTAPDAKLLGCPFCGGECELVSDGYGYNVVECAEDAGDDDGTLCPYVSGNAHTEAAAWEAHNTLARRAALHEELVGMLESVDQVDQDDARKWLDDRDALLQRARGEDVRDAE